MRSRILTPSARIAAVLTGLAAPAAAHERWVRHQLLSDFDRTLFESANAVNVGTWIGVALLAVGLLGLAARRARRQESARVAPGALRDAAAAVLGISTGVGLLLLIPAGEFLAPDLVLEGGLLGQAMRWGTLLVGALLVLGWRTRHAAWGLFALYAVALFARPFEPFDGEAISFVAVLNYLEVVGICVFLGIVGRGAFSLDGALGRDGTPDARRRELAVGVLRCALGATLILLGLQKFLFPEMPMGVLQNYRDAIYEPVAAWTGLSPTGYVFSASVVETTVGLVVLLGIFTRVWIAIVTVLFAITALIFQEELLGHLPLAGVAVVLLVEGGGGLRADRWLARRGAPRGLVGASASATVALAWMALVALGSTSCSRVSGDEAPQLAAPLESSSSGWIVLGERGRCRFELERRPAAIALNEFFSLRTRLVDHDSGETFAAEGLRLDASMPDHGHGMTTLPVTSRARDGSWRTEGCKLHMYGRWVFELEALGVGAGDRVSFEFDFRPPTQVR